MARPLENTTSITLGAFGLVAVLSSLCFSCSRALVDDAKEDKDRFVFAGERFLHSAILLLSAAVIKYVSLPGAALAMHFVNRGGLSWWLGLLIGLPGVVAGALFMWAIINAHGGLLIVNRLLWSRHSRYPDWDHWV